MSGHHKWKNIRFKRNMKSIIWTGDNDEEMTEFALNSDFAFVVGSNIRCEKDHDHNDWTDDDPCEEDKRILEVYNGGFLTGKGEAIWTHADPGDIVYENGSVTHNGPPVRFGS